MVLVWIVASPHGTDRPGGGRQGKHAMRRLLPKADWFQHLCAQCGVEPEWKPTVDKQDRRGNSLVGVAQIEPGTTYDGELTLWGNECDYLHEYFKCAEDAYSARVVRFMRLDQPLEMFRREVAPRSSRLRARHVDTCTFLTGESGIFKPIDFTSDSVGALSGSRDDRRSCTVADFFSEHGHADSSIETACALTLVRPIAELIVKGHWSDVMLLGRWRHTLFERFPPAVWLCGH